MSPSKRVDYSNRTGVNRKGRSCNVSNKKKPNEPKIGTPAGIEERDGTKTIEKEKKNAGSSPIPSRKKKDRRRLKGRIQVGEGVKFREKKVTQSGAARWQKRARGQKKTASARTKLRLEEREGVCQGDCGKTETRDREHINRKVHWDGSTYRTGIQTLNGVAGEKRRGTKAED